MTRNILHTALALGLALLLSGCGFLLAPVAGTAATAAQLSVKGADKGIEYSKQAADKSIDLGRQAAGASAELGRKAVGGVAAAARSVATTAADVSAAAITVLRPATPEEAAALEQRARQP